MRTCNDAGRPTNAVHIDESVPTDIATRRSRHYQLPSSALHLSTGAKDRVLLQRSDGCATYFKHNEFKRLRDRSGTFVGRFERPERLSVRTFIRQ
jgi:hypothetical protein